MSSCFLASTNTCTSTAKHTMPTDIEFWKVESRRFPPSPPEFECGERLEEGDVGSIVFHWVIREHSLQVSCRGRSVGVLTVNEKAVPDEDIDYEQVDANFFDPGYTLAGRTGFQIWAGSRLLMEALTLPTKNVVTSLPSWQRRLAEGAKVLELGSGTGVMGISLAATGAQVVLTDLPSLVDNATRPNICLNQTLSTHDKEAPSWMKGSDPIPLNKGWAGTASLDWTKPLSDKVKSMSLDAELVVACDCVWLRSMLQSLLDTVQALFENTTCKSPTLLLSFQRRDTSSDESMFTTVTSVAEQIRERHWAIDCLAWRQVAIDGKETEKEVFILEVKP